MSKLDSFFVFDKNKAKVKHSKLADIWGMNLALNNTIHLTSKAWDRYLNNDKRPDGLIFHEYRHLIQQKKTGFVLFLFLYLLCLPILWSPFRRKWELEAYKVSLAWRLKTYGQITPTYQKRLAKILSSWKYGFMISRKNAEDWISKTTSELRKLARQ